MPDVLESQLKDEREVTLPGGERISPSLHRHLRFKWALVGGGLALVVLLATVWHYFSIRESTDDAEIDGHIIPISAKVGGTVIEVDVEDNQSVKKGQVLAKIDPRDYQVAVDRAQADLAQAEASAQAAQTDVPIITTTSGSDVSTAEARLRNAQAGQTAARQESDAAEATEAASKARLTEAEANANKAEHDLARIKPLASKDEVSQQQYDATIAAAESARAAVASAKADVTVAQQNVAVARSHLTQAQSMVAMAQADVRTAATAPEHVAMSRAQAASADARAAQTRAALAQARLNLDYTVVRAPVDGVVSKKTVQLGEVIAPGEPLMAVVQLGDVWVTANFKESQLRNMRTGQEAVVSVDAYGGRTYHGHVDSLAAATGEKFSVLPPENATGNYVKVVQRVPVKIRFDPDQNADQSLRPGMSVEPTVITK
jgi:membrane fusion protein, multidrug efflux system